MEYVTTMEARLSLVSYSVDMPNIYLGEFARGALYSPRITLRHPEIRHGLIYRSNYDGEVKCDVRADFLESVTIARSNCIIATEIINRESASAAVIIRTSSIGTSGSAHIVSTMKITYPDVRTWWKATIVAPIHTNFLVLVGKSVTGDTYCIYILATRKDMTVDGMSFKSNIYPSFQRGTDHLLMSDADGLFLVDPSACIANAKRDILCRLDQFNAAYQAGVRWNEWNLYLLYDRSTLVCAAMNHVCLFSVGGHVQTLKPPLGARLVLRADWTRDDMICVTYSSHVHIQANSSIHVIFEVVPDKLKFSHTPDSCMRLRPLLPPSHKQGRAIGSMSSGSFNQRPVVAGTGPKRGRDDKDDDGDTKDTKRGSAAVVSASTATASGSGAYGGAATASGSGTYVGGAAVDEKQQRKNKMSHGVLMLQKKMHADQDTPFPAELQGLVAGYVDPVLKTEMLDVPATPSELLKRRFIADDYLCSAVPDVDDVNYTVYKKRTSDGTESTVSIPVLYGEWEKALPQFFDGGVRFIAMNVRYEIQLYEFRWLASDDGSFKLVSAGATNHSPVGVIHTKSLIFTDNKFTEAKAAAISDPNRGELGVGGHVIAVGTPGYTSLSGTGYQRLDGYGFNVMGKLVPRGYAFNEAGSLFAMVAPVIPIDWTVKYNDSYWHNKSIPQPNVPAHLLLDVYRYPSLELVSSKVVCETELMYTSIDLKFIPKTDDLLLATTLRDDVSLGPTIEIYRLTDVATGTPSIKCIRVLDADSFDPTRERTNQRYRIHAWITACAECYVCALQNGSDTARLSIWQSSYTENGSWTRIAEVAPTKDAMFVGTLGDGGILTLKCIRWYGGDVPMTLDNCADVLVYQFRASTHLTLAKGPRATGPKRSHEDDKDYKAPSATASASTSSAFVPPDEKEVGAKKAKHAASVTSYPPMQAADLKLQKLIHANRDMNLPADLSGIISGYVKPVMKLEQTEGGLFPKEFLTRAFVSPDYAYSLSHVGGGRALINNGPLKDGKSFQYNLTTARAVWFGANCVRILANHMPVMTVYEVRYHTVNGEIDSVDRTITLGEFNVEGNPTGLAAIEEAELAVASLQEFVGEEAFPTDSKDYKRVSGLISGDVLDFLGAQRRGAAFNADGSLVAVAVSLEQKIWHVESNETHRKSTLFARGNSDGMVYVDIYRVPSMERVSRTALFPGDDLGGSQELDVCFIPNTNDVFASFRRKHYPELVDSSTESKAISSLDVYRIVYGVEGVQHIRSQVFPRPFNCWAHVCTDSYVYCVQPANLDFREGFAKDVDARVYDLHVYQSGYESYDVARPILILDRVGMGVTMIGGLGGGEILTLMCAKSRDTEIVHLRESSEVITLAKGINATGPKRSHEDDKDYKSPVNSDVTICTSPAPPSDTPPSDAEKRMKYEGGANDSAAAPARRNPTSNADIKLQMHLHNDDALKEFPSELAGLVAGYVAPIMKVEEIQPQKDKAVLFRKFVTDDYKYAVQPFYGGNPGPVLDIYTKNDEDEEYTMLPIVFGSANDVESVRAVDNGILALVCDGDKRFSMRRFNLGAYSTSEDSVDEDDDSADDDDVQITHTPIKEVLGRTALIKTNWVGDLTEAETLATENDRILSGASIDPASPGYQSLEGTTLAPQRDGGSRETMSSINEKGTLVAIAYDGVFGTWRMQRNDTHSRIDDVSVPENQRHHVFVDVYRIPTMERVSRILVCPDTWRPDRRFHTGIDVKMHFIPQTNDLLIAYTSNVDNVSRPGTYDGELHAYRIAGADSATPTVEQIRKERFPLAYLRPFSMGFSISASAECYFYAIHDFVNQQPGAHLYQSSYVVGTAAVLVKSFVGVNSSIRFIGSVGGENIMTVLVSWEDSGVYQFRASKTQITFAKRTTGPKRGAEDTKDYKSPSNSAVTVASASGSGTAAEADKRVKYADTHDSAASTAVSALPRRMPVSNSDIKLQQNLHNDALTFLPSELSGLVAGYVAPIMKLEELANPEFDGFWNRKFITPDYKYVLQPFFRAGNGGKQLGIFKQSMSGADSYTSASISCVWADDIENVRISDKGILAFVCDGGMRFSMHEYTWTAAASGDFAPDNGKPVVTDPVIVGRISLVNSNWVGDLTKAEVLAAEDGRITVETGVKIRGGSPGYQSLDGITLIPRRPNGTRESLSAINDDGTLVAIVYRGEFESWRMQRNDTHGRVDRTSMPISERYNVFVDIYRIPTMDRVSRTLVCTDTWLAGDLEATIHFIPQTNDLLITCMSALGEIDSQAGGGTTGELNVYRMSAVDSTTPRSERIRNEPIRVVSHQFRAKFWTHASAECYFYAIQEIDNLPYVTRLYQSSYAMATEPVFLTTFKAASYLRFLGSVGGENVLTVTDGFSKWGARQYRASKSQITLAKQNTRATGPKRGADDTKDHKSPASTATASASTASASGSSDSKAVKKVRTDYKDVTAADVAASATAPRKSEAMLVLRKALHNDASLVRLPMEVSDIMAGYLTPFGKLEQLPTLTQPVELLSRLFISPDYTRSMHQGLLYATDPTTGLETTTRLALSTSEWSNIHKAVICEWGVRAYQEFDYRRFRIHDFKSRPSDTPGDDVLESTFTSLFVLGGPIEMNGNNYQEANAKARMNGRTQAAIGFSMNKSIPTTVIKGTQCIPSAYTHLGDRGVAFNADGTLMAVLATCRLRDWLVTYSETVYDVQSWDSENDPVRIMLEVYEFPSRKPLSRTVVCRALEAGASIADVSFIPGTNDVLISSQYGVYADSVSTSPSKFVLEILRVRDVTTESPSIQLLRSVEFAKSFDCLSIAGSRSYVYALAVEGPPDAIIVYQSAYEVDADVLEITHGNLANMKRFVGSFEDGHVLTLVCATDERVDGTWGEANFTFYQYRASASQITFAKQSNRNTGPKRAADDDAKDQKSPSSSDTSTASAATASGSSANAEGGNKKVKSALSALYATDGVVSYKPRTEAQLKLQMEMHKGQYTPLMAELQGLVADYVNPAPRIAVVDHAGSGFAISENDMLAAPTRRIWWSPDMRHCVRAVINAAGTGFTVTRMDNDDRKEMNTVTPFDGVCRFFSDGIRTYSRATLAASTTGLIIRDYTYVNDAKDPGRIFENARSATAAGEPDTGCILRVFGKESASELDNARLTDPITSVRVSAANKSDLKGAVTTIVGHTRSSSTFHGCNSSGDGKFVAVLLRVTTNAWELAYDDTMYSKRLLVDREGRRVSSEMFCVEVFEFPSGNRVSSSALPACPMSTVHRHSMWFIPGTWDIFLAYTPISGVPLVGLGLKTMVKFVRIYNAASTDARPEVIKTFMNGDGIIPIEGSSTQMMYLNKLWSYKTRQDRCIVYRCGYDRTSVPTQIDDCAHGYAVSVFGSLDDAGCVAVRGYTTPDRDFEDITISYYKEVADEITLSHARAATG